ncbi:alpha/beta hydrolase [Kibdelosporangium aridum]|uniref:Alpha/beta hydrolase n=1 Tax=Kibdelosporangium aridum TaxID=2030 RepID=A0A428YWX5_KIBAR|nr:alpha/beta hydrolase [Kibdelosporangium aridum]RSM74733.1 alpha/beta hydrolase [Kibdelosporangium aridum]
MNNAELARSLGFTSEYADVNGTRLHYVTGGAGSPLVLLGGWPHTWWEFRKILPPLARHHRVVAVDLRGMGGSDKPESGYDKKTMARDIAELIKALGFEQPNVVGHDIGAMVAYSLAANHPATVSKLALVEVPHPDEAWFGFTMLPQPPVPHLWWFAFNQLTELPQVLLNGRFRALIDHLCAGALVNQDAITDVDRQIYAEAYDSPDAIRASNDWYQTFVQDIQDVKTYAPVSMPVLGLAAEGNAFLETALRKQSADFQIEYIANTGHYVAEEQPEAVVEHLLKFFG